MNRNIALQQVSYRPSTPPRCCYGRFYRHQSITQKGLLFMVMPVGTLSELIGDLGNKLFGRQLSFPAGWIFLCAA